ncbi:(d)CMP kinase [Hutsoniella sourekii]|uniref:(d)CMP kinase n=1 Tax=Hutsoniella sourekii TaxID=87650 RepID=UPI000482E3F0|nr:(d)CMP kinase [Hutsoniella sourekii]
MIPNIQIAIDGPASSGKSTLAKQLAQDLDLIYIDTGAMYRAITLATIQSNTDLSSDRQVEELLESLNLTFRIDQGQQNIFLNGQKLDQELRSPQVNQAVSKVSANPLVREFLVKTQQDVAQSQSVIMDGRDIGTVVLPEADFKFFLTASPRVRAQRRYDENMEKGYSNQTLEEIEKEIIKRDHLDSTREISPLTKAKDAIEIDTSDLSIQELVAKIKLIIQDKN